MVIELFSSGGASLVCQAIAGVEISDRSVGRNLLEGLVRELVEFQLHRFLHRAGPEDFKERLEFSREAIERELGRDLAHRGVKLTGLTLRAVRTEEKFSRLPGTYRWTEFLSPEIGTRDGFQVVIDTVSLVRARQHGRGIEPLYARRCTVAALSEALITGAGGRDLEDLMMRRDRWTGEALERAQEILTRAELHLEFLAVTEVVVRPRQQSLRPRGKAADFTLGGLSWLPYPMVAEREETGDPAPGSH